MSSKIETRVLDNPFYVLGLRPSATAMEIEREGQKLLGMLAVGLSAAERYPTPVGEMKRTSDKVRSAMAELRDPKKRIAHELWARLPADAMVELEDPETDGGDAARPWPDAMRAMGF